MNVRAQNMMYILLKQLKQIPLTFDTAEAFLYSCACAAIVSEITVYDWEYLAHLMAFRIRKERSKHE